MPIFVTDDLNNFLVLFASHGDFFEHARSVVSFGPTITSTISDRLIARRALSAQSFLGAASFKRTIDNFEW
jgi:hypothetical protein